MLKTHHTVIFALGFVTLAVASFTLPAISQSTDEAMKAYMAVHQKMMTSMQDMKMSGDADKDFAMMMIPHHQGAVDMAEVELKFGKDAQLKAMAQKIIDAQKAEIEDFKKWQAAHGK